MTRARNAAPERVLYVVSLFPAWSETFIVREIEQLVARGVDVRILTLKLPPDSRVQAAAAALAGRVIRPHGPMRTLARAAQCLVGAPVRVAGSIAVLVAGLWRQPLVLAKSLFALWRALGVMHEIVRFDPQLVHAHWATYPSSVALCLGRILGRPFSFTSHAHDIFVEDHMLARKLADAELAVTISHFNVAHLTRRFGQAKGLGGLKVVRCGVDQRRLPDPASLPARVDGLVASVGRLDPIKGFDVLVRALGLLQHEAESLHCVLVGEGGLRPQLEALREQAGLGERLEMPGARPQEDVQALMARASVFVMPSVVTSSGNRDGIPVALMEAMAGGAAVVSTRVSGIPELVQDGVNGLLVEPGDAHGLARAIQRLLGDPALRARLGAAARSHVLQEFEVSTEAARLLEHFARAIRPPVTADER